MADLAKGTAWWRSLAIVAMVAVLLVGCAPVTGTKAGPGAPPVTITLEIPEQGQTMPYLPVVRSFASDVDRLSSGAMRIALTSAPLPWHTTTEVELARAVEAGDVSMALVPTRAYGALGHDGFLALEAPFLVTSSAGGAAVERSALAKRMLGSLTGGTVGLALVFETVRLPVSYDAPFVTPEDLAGKRIRVGSSTIIPKTVAALGAVPVDADALGNGPDGTPLDGADGALGWSQSLPSSAAVITTGLPLSAKFNVLVVARAQWDALDVAQRSVLTRAGEKLHERDVIGEASAQAKTFCTTGAHHVAVDAVARGRFEQLAAPVVVELERDARVAREITAVRGLVAHAPADDLPVECKNATGDGATWRR